MSTLSTLDAHISREFNVIHIGSLTQDMNSFHPVSPPFSILVDADDQVMALLNTQDVLRLLEVKDSDERVNEVFSTLPTSIVVEAASTMEDFVRSRAFIGFLDGARGAIVMQAGEPTGVLSPEAIGKFLDAHPEFANDYRPSNASDTVLPGKPTTGKIIMYCDDYKHRNELAYYDRQNPPNCQETQPTVHPIRR